jgi:hypothetical protein
MQKHFYSKALCSLDLTTMVVVAAEDRDQIKILVPSCQIACFVSGSGILSRH